MRVLVTGGAGMLGHDLVPMVAGPDTRVLTRADADLADAGALAAAVAGDAPEVIFHLAAWTDVDGCEREPARAERDNVVATTNVARYAARAGALLVAVSTDYVFDGTATAPIPPDAPTRPINEYGRSKERAERAIRRHAPRHLIVRTSWLIGAHGRNFVETIRARARAGERLRVVDDQRGAPTFTFDLAPALVALAQRGATGTLHVTNDGDCTWFELARETLRLDGVEAPLERVATGEFGRPAARPAYSVLDNAAAFAILGGPLPPWRASLARYLRETSAPAGKLGGGGRA